MPAESLRLFFALPCPPTLARQISDWRDLQGLAGAPVPLANLHMTLAFLGSQPAAGVEALCALAASIQVPRFTLQLDQTTLIGGGYACLEPSTTPDALLQLVSKLNEGLRALGIEPDPRPFRPHVTLLRNACGQPTQAPLLSWPAQAFGLYASHNDAAGVRYQALASWPLQAAR